MSDAHALLRGLATRLNTSLTAIRRHVDTCDEATLREELAEVAALVEEARPAIGEDAIAAHREAAREKLVPREPVEISPADGYALWAESYDAELNPLIMLEEPVLEPLIGEVAGNRVLDVGCGTGRYARRLAARGAMVTGIDPSPEMLATARAQAEAEGVRVKFIEGGFGDLPHGKQFDLIICNLVLCHIPEISGPISEMAMCLKPGGRLVISDFHYMCQIIGWRTAFSHEGQRYHVENYLHSYGDFVRALREAGLQLTALEDLMIGESLRGKGLDPLVDKWSGFPFGMVVAAVK
ncbi:MAG: class I SAM-dependent methyltransferase [Armatimonadia bacterium]